MRKTLKLKPDICRRPLMLPITPRRTFFACTEPPARDKHFSDADTREARAYYGQPFAPRSDRRRGSY